MRFGPSPAHRRGETFNAPSRVAAPMGLLTWALVGLGHLALLGAALLLTSQAPLRSGRGFAWPQAGQLRPLAALFALYWGVIAVHMVLVQLDPALTAWVGRDYARVLYDVEGDAVAAFQGVQHPALDVVVLGAYMFGYPFMIYFAPFFYLLHRDRRALRLAALSFAVLYALTLPFYVLAPVSNPWQVAHEPWYQGRAVSFRLGELWPDIVDSYWRFTTPNNELPSLHAAISAMTTMVAWKLGYRRFAGFAACFAAAIPLASFYLGVHWLLDALVGEAFALMAVAAGLKLSARFPAAGPAVLPAPGPGPEG